MRSAPVIIKKKRSRGITKAQSFTIVAIGASAGGLEAITRLLQNLPSQTGMAFIYIQHLSPDHKSILTSLLSKSTSMKVQEVKDKMLIEPDNLYVIPPDKQMELVDGHISLTPRSKDRSLNLPIDTFFCSLAERHKDGAIGIILSGSASDGTLGMKAIKHEGGLTFAQDDSAKFNSMPKSAVAAGVVDFILSPKEIALELVRLSKHRFVKSNGIKSHHEDLIENSNPDLTDILQQIHKATGVDFNVYKMNTIKRRIIRRMLLYKIETLKEYSKLLADKSNEIDILYQDLLINVTGFFRDTMTHQFLKKTLFPRLLKSRKDETLRIWVVACSTGEEAYSFAMILQEIQDNNSTNIPIQIFATDLSGRSITKARIGVYSKQELASVSPKRIQRFYTKCDGGFRITKSIRDMCVFAPHNILNDPPFSRLDFISCCNLFIYLDTAAQKKAISTFHYALKDDGYLMLGKSENISSSMHLFTSNNKKYKIFTRKNNSGVRILPVITPRLSKAVKTENKSPESSEVSDLARNKAPVAPRGLESAIDAVLVSDFMPASVVINHEMEILQFRGSTDLYLTHSQGKATFNILKMVRPEIAFELRNIISQAIKSKNRVRNSGIELKVNAKVHVINIEAMPLKVKWDEPLVLILFSEQEQVEITTQKSPGKSSDSAAKNRRIKKLEAELAMARNNAHIYAQEQEAYTEELQSANEEVISSNEELQSVNEELETSKEEIESTNEELTTTNQELQTRNDLLNESYEYSEAIISTIHEPMIILDKDLRVKSANKSFYKEFQLTESEAEGLLFFQLGNNQWDIPALRELLQDIIPRNTNFHDFEVTHTFPDAGEKIMLLNASRIVQKLHGVQLILLAINDITERATIQIKEKELFKRDINETKSYNQKLSKAVEERTHELELANNKLEEKNLELIKMNKELEAFAYISSHDLQEPLRKIQTFASRIIEQEVQTLSDKGKDYFNRMHKAAMRMQRLIDDLLAFSHVNVTERKFERIHLSKIVDDVLIELSETIEGKKAKIKFSGLCEVSIIQFQFRQLLENLISNALKFSDPRKPLNISIKCRIVGGIKLKKVIPSTTEESQVKLDTSEDYFHITVTDNGIGFEPHFREKIFEVFQKLHVREQYPGTGVGLAIVRKIVENHNGIITAAGQLGKGAKFDIYIPYNNV